MGIEIVKFRKYEKNTLQGFLTILMTEVGLEVRDATLHQKEGKRWIGLPAKPYQKEDGSTAYAYVIKFVDKGRYQQFQNAVLKALDGYLSEEIESIPDEDIPF